jgi:hypothetical protein
MAQSLYANLAQFNEQIQLAMLEANAEQYNLFNSNINGAIAMVDGDVQGEFPDYGYFSNRNTASRRDRTSTSARTPSGSVQTDIKHVTLSRGLNEDQTISALRLAGIDIRGLTTKIAQKFAEDTMKDALYAALSGLVGTMLKQSTSYLDISALSSNNTISVNACWNALQKLGDASTNVKCMLMHSYQATALKQALGASSSLGQVIGSGVVRDDSLSGHFLRPVFITDNTTLKVDATSASGAYDTYRTLFLTEAAATVKKMTTVEVMAYEDRAYDNAMLGCTGEYELELGVKGFSYTQGTGNPTNSTIATTSSWTKRTTDIKNGPGVCLITR